MVNTSKNVQVAVLHQGSATDFVSDLTARFRGEGISCVSTTEVEATALGSARHLALILPLSPGQIFKLRALLADKGRWRLSPDSQHVAVFLSRKAIQGNLRVPGVQPLDVHSPELLECAMPHLINTFQARGTPVPDYPNAGLKVLGDALELAQSELDRLMIIGEDGLNTEQVVQNIVQLKREMRDGGDIVEGFILAGRYRLLSRVGAGGFATVWKAWDRRILRVVALKVLHTQHAYDKTRLERFFQGAEQMTILSHDNIVEVYDPRVRDGGYQFFVMRYVEGENLQRLVLNGELTRRQLLQAILQVGAALSFAHKNGVIHRDIKPANILIDGQLRVHLTDFDLVWVQDSRLELTTGALGTFIFAAPEQMRSGDYVSARRDVYSLGMTTAFGLHGDLLAPAVLYERERFVDSLPIPLGAKEVLHKAISVNPEFRQPTVASFCAELGRAFMADDYGIDDLSLTRVSRTLDN